MSKMSKNVKLINRAITALEEMDDPMTMTSGDYLQAAMDALLTLRDYIEGDEEEAQ